jgi:hypothetical protein
MAYSSARFELGCEAFGPLVLLLGPLALLLYWGGHPAAIRIIKA